MTLVGYADLAAEILARPPRLGGVRVVAVDGPAGAGKTTFAARLATAVRAAGADVSECCLERDGEAIRPELLAWMGSEAAHFAVDRPAEHADVLVDGAPGGHFPETVSGFLGDISGWTTFDTLRDDPRDTPDRGRGGRTP